ncbi:MAG: 2,3-bisphosphoglycerate-dependent phosphoglycerate mutase [Sphingomonas sp.]
MAFTSFQTRAITTLHLALEAMGRLWLPEEKSWKLNERHYGGSPGSTRPRPRRSTASTRSDCGAAASTCPRRCPRKAARGTFEGRALPGRADPADREPEGHDRARAALWEARIAPELKAGRRVVISAHGNSLRALVKHLSGISDDAITGLEIPTGQPIVYELDAELNATDRYYLSER